MSQKAIKKHRPLAKAHTTYKKTLDGILCRVALSTSTPISRIKNPIHGTNAKGGLNTHPITSPAGKGNRNMRRGNRSKRAFGERCLWA